MEVLALLQEKEIERLRSELAGIHENVTAKEQKRSSDVSKVTILLQYFNISAVQSDVVLLYHHLFNVASFK